MGRYKPAFDGRESLQGSFLVASPHLQDPNFARSVVYLCEHNAEGAMGLIVNRPLSGVDIGDVIRQLEIEADAIPKTLKVYFGGPVETGRGFVLHTARYSCPETASISETVSLTAHPQILRDIATGRGPERMLFMLGYAGWAPGQLEQEIMADDWLTCPGNHRILFETSDAEKWAHLYHLLGVEPSWLSATFGTA